MFCTLAMSMFAKRNISGNTRWNRLWVVFIIFLVWTGESGRKSGVFFIWTMEMVASAGGWISLERYAAQRSNFKQEKLSERQSHMTSQELFLIRDAIWCICTIKSMLGNSICRKKSEFPSKMELRWMVLTNQTGEWALHRCLLSPF